MLTPLRCPAVVSFGTLGSLTVCESLSPSASLGPNFIEYVGIKRDLLPKSKGCSNVSIGYCSLRRMHVMNVYLVLCIRDVSSIRNRIPRIICIVVISHHYFERNYYPYSHSIEEAVADV